jgi:2-polyprenyl-6-methoxyphenol hydroxylase-like FAD-dependent oxidoreductase
VTQLLTSVDVLVVGAGPTGLMLANQLARRGVRATIIDRHSGPAQQTRAMAVHARTLEIYSKLGIAARAIELGKVGAGINVWSRGRLKANVPFAGAGTGLTPFPYVLMLGQDDSEHIMGDRLREQGIDIRWNTELMALAQEPDRVVATIKEPDGTSTTISAAYVAGCDGGRSTVRELTGIGFPGAPYENVFFVADTEATGSMVPEQLNVYLWSGGFHLYFPIRGTNRWRVIGILPAHLQDQADLRFEQLVPTLIEAGSAGLAFASCSWFSTYRIHHRCTEHFRDRRCFLAGDAAHVHSPMGGQGMNTGLQDAYNLAWKLALVVSGRADSSLLDSYEAERAPFAHLLLATTDRAFQMVVSDHWIAAMLRTRIIGNVMSLAMRFRRVQNTFFWTVSQIGISYRDSPVSQTLAGVDRRAPQAGDRFPWMKLRLGTDAAARDLFEALDDTRFNLLVIGQAPPSREQLGYGELLAIHLIPFDQDNAAALSRVSIRGPAYYLLRPDGHVGLAGTRFDPGELKRWFEKVHVDLAASIDARPGAGRSQFLALS